MNKIKITIQSCWSEPSEVRQLKKDWKLKEKNIKATFTDGGDYYSSWTFDGPVNHVEDILRKNWELNPKLDFKDALEEYSDDCDLEYKFY